MNTEVNFVRAELCDNDFGRQLKDALEAGLPERDKMCPILWKKHIVAYVISLNIQHHFCGDQAAEINWPWMQKTEQYLSNNLRVTFERTAPTDDHNGGSACIDLHTGTAWTY